MRLQVAVAALALAGACAEGGIVVGEDGVGARAERGRVRAAAGPDDAAVGYAGERVVGGVGTDAAAAGVRVDGGPVVAGVRTEEDEGTFGGLGFGF